MNLNVSLHEGATLLASLLAVAVSVANALVNVYPDNALVVALSAVLPVVVGLITPQPVRKSGPTT